MGRAEVDIPFLTLLGLQDEMRANFRPPGGLLTRACDDANDIAIESDSI
jgi:hypothetical protein